VDLRVLVNLCLLEMFYHNNFIVNTFAIRGYWQVYISGGADIYRTYFNINSDVYLINII